MYSDLDKPISKNLHGYKMAQNIFISTAPQSEEVDNIGGSSSVTNTYHSLPLSKSASGRQITSDDTINHVPFEQRFVYGGHSEYGSVLHEHHRNRYHTASRSKPQIVMGCSPSWYNEPLEYYPVSRNAIPVASQHPSAAISDEKHFVRRIPSFHQNCTLLCPSHQRVKQPVFTSPEQYMRHNKVPQRLYHSKHIAFMGDVKARQAVERHYSTLGHRQRPILHHTYPANKKNITRIMITGAPQNYVHKSQSLRRNSPYTVRRVGSFIAHPVNDMLQNQQLVLVNNYYGSKRFKTNDDTSERDRRVEEVEEHTQSPVSFAHRFNSSTSVHINSPQENSPHISNVRGFDDALTLTRLRNEQSEDIENNEVHTISLESRHNSLPNPRAGGRGGANKSFPNHFVKVNNYVGSLDRRSQFNSKATPQKQREPNHIKAERINHGTRGFYRSIAENRITDLSEQPVGKLSSHLKNFAETHPVSSKSVPSRSEVSNKHKTKKSVTPSTRVVNSSNYYMSSENTLTPKFRQKCDQNGKFMKILRCNINCIMLY